MVIEPEKPLFPMLHSYIERSFRAVCSSLPQCLQPHVPPRPVLHLCGPSLGHIQADQLQAPETDVFGLRARVTADSATLWMIDDWQTARLHTSHCVHSLLYIAPIQVSRMAHRANSPHALYLLVSSFLAHQFFFFNYYFNQTACKDHHFL